MDFIKAFHIDCGRKFFTKDELLSIVRKMGENNYNLLELAIGNGGMRFVLDDMTVTTGAQTYDSEDVKNAINEGNKSFYDCGNNSLSESDMEAIITLAGSLNISIMPLLNSPGHMEAIVTAMEILGIENVRYSGSRSTIDLDNAEAVDFTKALVEKYVKWFGDRDSQFFNVGCDEYANDVLKSGFASLTEKKNFKYDLFISYANDIAGIVKKYKMTPVMFNDGMYYNKVIEGGMLDKDIVCSFWTEGWPGYTPSPAQFVENCGHRILNTSNRWYYVLGRREDSPNRDFCYVDAEREVSKAKYDKILGYKKGSPIGAMMCLWCDEPYIKYDKDEEEKVHKLIGIF